MTLPEEIGSLIHAIRHEQQSLRLALELQNARIQQIEQMTKDHMSACAENKEQMQELYELMQTIKQGMRVTNFLRNAFVWVAGLVTAAIGLWHTFK